MASHPSIIEAERPPPTSVDANTPKEATPLTVTALIVSAIAVFSYYFFLFRYSYNFPYFDDFEVILDFLNRFLTTGQGSEKLRLLFEQHGEHRLVFDRVVALVECYLFGQVEFRSLILIGSTALAVILVLFCKTARRDAKLSPLHLAPVALLLFNFRYFEASFWPMAALQNLWVLCFAFLAFYFLFQRNSSSVYVAAAFGLMATFTSANGMVTFAAGALVLALNRQLLTRKSLIWGAAGFVAILSYLHGYEKPGQHPEVLRPLLENPAGFVGYVLAFLGSVFTQNVIAAVAIGSAFVGFAGYLTLRRYFARDPICYALIVFLLVTGALAGFSRFGFGMEQALASRYAIVSTLLAVSCYVALMSLVQHRSKTVYGIAILIASLAFHYSTYATYLPGKKAEKAEFEKFRDQISQGRLSRFNFGWPPLDIRREFPRHVLRTADSLGYFSFKFRDEAEIIGSLPSNSERQSVHRFDRFEQKGPVVVMLAGWALIKGIPSEDVIPVLCFKDEKNHPAKYIVPSGVRRNDVAQQYEGDGVNYLMSGFETMFNANEIKPGKYRLVLVLVAPDFKIEIDAGPTRLGQ